MHTVFSLEKLNVRDHSEDAGIDGRIILEWILVKGMNWIHLTKDKELFGGCC